jgi:hypothetical protein
MTTFKIYIRKDSNSVVIKGKLKDYDQFSDLRQKVFDSTQKATFKANNQNLQPTEKFKLAFGDKKDNSFIPEDLSEGLFDDESFKYFKNQVNAHGVNDGKYKLYIEKVDSLPEFKKKGLMKFWKKI